jgi:hypothetical protein
MYLLHGLYSTQQILTRASINRAELRFSTIDARNKLQIYSAHTFISYLSLFLGSRLASLLTSKTNQPNAWTRQGRLWLAKLYIALPGNATKRFLNTEFRQNFNIFLWMERLLFISNHNDMSSWEQANPAIASHNQPRQEHIVSLSCSLILE